VSKYLTAAN